MYSATFLTGYYSCDKMKPKEIGRACGTYGGRSRGLDRILVGTHEGEMPLGRLRHKCEDNIKMDIEDVG